MEDYSRVGSVSAPGDKSGEVTDTEDESRGRTEAAACRPSQWWRRAT